MQFSGIEASGVTFEGKDQYASIPGLIELNELDFEVETIVNGANLDVRRIGDRSGLGNRIEGGSGPRRGQLIDFAGGFKSLRMSGSGKWNTNNVKAGWNNVIRQQPFGIFMIVARNAISNLSYFLKHSGNSPGKFWFYVNSAGAIQHQFRNASNSETLWGTANSIFAVDNSAQAIDLLCYGTAEATKMEMFHNTVSRATRTTTNIAGTEVADNEIRYLESGEAGTQMDLIMLAVYDWTGYTKSQIDVFRARVNAIREEKYGSIF